MKDKIVSIIKHPRVILLLVCIVVALLLIQPTFTHQGVAIRHVQQDGAAHQAGIPIPTSDQVRALQWERILHINDERIDDVTMYFSFIDNAQPGDLLDITTNRNTYLVRVEAHNETNQTLDIGLDVVNAPTNKIRKGLDLQGGTRVLLRPEGNITDDEFEHLRDILELRLNMFGLSDIRVTVVRNLPQAIGGVPQFIMVEIAGINIAEVQELIASQGKFEGYVGDTLVFGSGQRDVSIPRGTGNSGITTCGPSADGGFVCSYFLNIVLSQEAARRQADATRPLQIVTDGGRYLSEDLRLFLDDELMNELRISADLRGSATNHIQITGSGEGSTEREARQDAIANMRQMQNILQTGSLPVSLHIEKADTISPTLGSAFIRNSLLVGLLAILGVVSVILIRYRRPIIAIPVIITGLVEVLLVLAAAVVLQWQLDLAAIAGIIIVIGSSVDHQIVIIDQTLRSTSLSETWKQRVKRAFAIILGAYITTVAALLPLLFFGAGLLKGFALTTIVGVTLGVLITRPAFAVMMEVLLSDEKS
ncbi:MAG: hypothetical protein ACMXYC_01990 [Candidatus Woesearchaeota archaeon]